MVQLEIPARKAINILGYNSAEWVISFAGAIIANCVPVGIYTTYDSDTCLYI